MTWSPEQIWLGQECFIIGGGSSLRDFDWSLLKDENTIGCNNAFRLGTEICKVCLFVDHKFIFDKHGDKRQGFYTELRQYALTNLVITNNTNNCLVTEQWLKRMPRLVKGMSNMPDKLGYNLSCGATAINLALLFGAKTIYLLGFDMQLDKQNRPNWHEHLIDNPNIAVYKRMLEAFDFVRRDLNKFPGCQVINVSDCSRLTYFPIVNTKTFWGDRCERQQKTSAA